MTKNSTMKIYLLMAIGSILISCGTAKETTTEVIEESTEVVTEVIESASEETQASMKPEKNTMIKAQIGEMKDGDPIQIEGVRREGNTLFLDVSYGGGCGEHSFEMNGSMAVMKSMPPQRAVKLTHTNHEDYCKAIVRKTIEVDISELSDVKQKGSTIILLLDGWKERIEYTFE